MGCSGDVFLCRHLWGHVRSCLITAHAYQIGFIFIFIDKKGRFKREYLHLRCAGVFRFLSYPNGCKSPRIEFQTLGHNYSMDSRV
jgi:hypothetical protein